MPMHESRRKNILGVLGGMGALASAEFVRTVYEYSGQMSKQEQQAPVVILYSDPTFPDRTEAFLKKEDQVVLNKLIDSLNRLCEMGATHIVMCCMTIHYLLPRIPDHLRKRIISMLDVIYEQLTTARRRHLLICSTGTQRMALFESHPGWQTSKDKIVLLDDSDQRKIHELIYEVKKNLRLEETVAFLSSLFARHEVDSFIAGCSEVHLLAKQLKASGDYGKAINCIDPLEIIASRLMEQGFYEA